MRTRRKIVVNVVMQVALLFGAVSVCAAFPSGYTLEQSGTGFASLSSNQFHSSPQSMHMGTVTTSDTSAIVFGGGQTLDTITQLSYWMYPVATGTASEDAPWVAIYLDDRPNRTLSDWFTDYGNSSSDVYYLQGEPYYAYSFPTLNTWQKVDAFGATPLKWESLEYYAHPHDAPTLADYISGAAMDFTTVNYSHQHFATRTYGGLYVVAIKIRMGSGSPWTNTEAYVDDVTIGNYYEPFGSLISIPALSEVGLAALGALLFLAGVYFLKR